MNMILGVVLIVLGTILLVAGFFFATSANMGGETEAFVYQVVFIGLGLGC